MAAKNIIGDQSIGLQANGNIIINNDQKLAELGQLALLPVIESIGHQLKGTFQESIKATTDEIKQLYLKEHLRCIEEYKKQIGEITKEERNQHPKEATVEGIKLFQDWIGNVQEICPEDKTLSEIWQRWMIELSQGTDLSLQKIIFDKMKLLQAKDAELLLSVLESSIGMNRYNEETNYRIIHLLEIGILEKVNWFSFERLSMALFAGIINAGIFCFVLGKLIFLHNQPNLLIIISIIIAVVSVLLGLYFYSYKSNSYKLSWVGSKIASYAMALPKKEENPHIPEQPAASRTSAS